MQILYNLNNGVQSVAVDAYGIPLPPTFLSFGVSGQTVQVGEEFEVHTASTYDGDNEDIIAFFSQEPSDEYYGQFFSKQDEVTPKLIEPHRKFREIAANTPYGFGETGVIALNAMWQLIANTVVSNPDGLDKVLESVEKTFQLLNGDFGKDAGDDKTVLVDSLDRLVPDILLYIVDFKYEAITIEQVGGSIAQPGVTNPDMVVSSRSAMSVVINDIVNDDEHHVSDIGYVLSIHRDKVETQLVSL